MKKLLISLALLLSKAALGQTSEEYRDYRTRPVTVIHQLFQPGQIDPNGTTQYAKLCSTDGNCDAVLAVDIRPGDSPGRYRFESIRFITSTASTASQIISRLEGISLPNKVQVNRVYPAFLQEIMAKAALTVDEANANRDPNPGEKMIDCVIDAFTCGASSLTGAILSSWGWLAAVKECNSMRKTCGDFKSVWEREHAYWKALEEENRKNGMGPSPHQPSTGSTGASHGVPSFPIGTGLPGKEEYAEVPCDACVITEW
jgi:hypothetical protein